ncbi:DUF2785 domain-containing protein [Dictyobacter arantiisoli]|uniref:DUF2785 domain-containing protein n=1 Tax=Dictyobacter arantiisoli TaxID=2014874 RepID=A0A5A5T5Y9_9CHLR|nr:DUF2785 domain-containing protein [Dictyobacter arantiisoli]GCF06777.1 hypothetical protein KDI_03410 [Dictyobacter arantiisoli]
MDKAFWRSIAIDHYRVPAGYQLEPLTDELLHTLGASDPERRDYYIYTTLENWIKQGLYTPEQLRAMIVQLLANIKLKLGEQGDDTVLLRSFSALTLSEVIKYDNAHPFLTESEVRQLVEQSINYLIKEQDLRGYVAGKGWIHAVAHASDLLGVLARNRYVDTNELEKILSAIAEKITTPVEHVYITVEDERLALAVIAALTRNHIQSSFWRWWCRQLSVVEESLNWENIARFARQADICAYHNTRLFLHALYFQLTLAGYQLAGAAELLAAVTNAIHRLDAGFYSVEVLKVVDPDIDTDQLRP